MKFLDCPIVVAGNTTCWWFQKVFKFKLGVALEGVKSPCIGVKLGF